MAAAESQPLITEGLDGRSFGTARLAGSLEGRADRRPSLVLLHGLTFDRRMWEPAIGALREFDPGRQVLALDLPGHGGSPGLSFSALDEIGAAIASAVKDAGLEAPVVVGHSMSGVIATFFAAIYPTRGVVNVDQTLDTAFIEMLQANREVFTGPGFAQQVWPMLLASMQIDVLPHGAQRLLNTDTPDQELVLAYWRQAIEMPLPALKAMIDDTLAVLRDSHLPYAVVAGHAYDSAYTTWLRERLPQSTVEVYPNSGHFPHLADPRRFAECLAATGRWTTEGA